MVSLQTRIPSAIPIEGPDTCDEFIEERGEPINNLLTIPLHDDNMQHAVCIGLRLDEPLKQLLNFISHGESDVLLYLLVLGLRDLHLGHPSFSSLFRGACPPSASLLRWCR